MKLQWQQTSWTSPVSGPYLTLSGPVFQFLPQYGIDNLTLTDRHRVG